MANRFYEILIIPEKTSKPRRFIVPNWAFQGAALGLAFAFFLAFIMALNYWYVMSQIGENRQLKMDNRKLRQQVQVFKNKMTTVENTMERVKTFATRLKVITNIEDHGTLLQSLNEKLPDAATNVGAIARSAPVSPTSPPADPPGTPDAPTGPAQATAPHPPSAAHAATPAGPPVAAQSGPLPDLANTPAGSAAGSGAEALAENGAENAEDLELHREYEALDTRFTELNHDTLYVEQTLQDEYELLADQKSFLAALPTRKPAVGYFTSGFGVRKSPIGGRVKMHEGLDIANRPGTLIKAPADGVVAFADTKAGYGKTVVLDHGYGLQTWYGHTRQLVVKKGQRVRRGDTIALLGNTGRSTGPHVHYEVRVHGTPVNPLSYILEN